MKNITSITRGIVIVAMMGLGVASAQASVIGFDSSVVFSQTPYNVTVGGHGAAGYIFSRFLHDPTGGVAGGSSPGVATRGTGLVSASPIAADTASTYLDGTSIDDNMVLGGPFEAFDEPAQAQVDSDFAFLGLKFRLDDGAHFGYAEPNGFTLTRFAYQSVPDAAIRTGQPIDHVVPGGEVNPVPAPNGAWLFGIGLGLVAWTRLRKGGREQWLMG